MMARLAEYQNVRRIKKALLADEQLLRAKRAIFRVLERWPTPTMTRAAWRRTLVDNPNSGFVYAPYIPLITTENLEAVMPEAARRFAERFARPINREHYGNEVLLGYKGDTFHAGL